jgi:hypothetical protein
MIQQFIGAFLLSSVLLTGGSLLWPVFTKQTRPAILQAVRDKVVETEAGKKAEDVLGVYTNSDNVSGTVSSVSSQLVSQAGLVVQKKVEEVVTTRIIEEVVKRFETLPNEQKEEVKTIICKPSE